MKLIIIITVASICLSIKLSAQGFTDINAGLTGLHFSDVAWGDYDADGDLDALIAGADAGSVGVTKLYKNEGNDTFTEVPGLPIPGTFVGDIAWGDYDSDGDLDILILGFTDASQITKLYKNTGGDNFVESGIIFPALSDGSVSFADYNNDGYTDILIAGFGTTEYVAKIYRNNGDTTFTETSIDLPGTIKCSYEWGDYDNDGDLDIFLTGFDFNGNLISKLYENNGDETFTETLNSFTGAWLGDAAWGDYDSDGDLDLLLSGFAFPNNRIAELYSNNGDGTFTELDSTGLIGVSHSSSIWADYDNDGDLDVFIGGTYEQGGGWIRVTDVFINNDDSTFTKANFTFTADVFWGESAWGDYDVDGDMDLICCGHDDLGGSNTIIYRNDISTTNTIPDAPTNLFANVVEDSVTFSWDPSTDNETPSAGLTYNAYIRNDSGDIIWNSLANTTNGYRYIPAFGNAQQNTNWVIKDLSDGNYFWSVQAIDNNFAGSHFAAEQSFLIGPTGIEDLGNPEEFSLLQNYPNPFNPSTNISFTITEAGFTSLKVYDVLGNKVATIINEEKPAGEYEIKFNADGLISGIYFYRLKAGNFIETKKMILIK